MNRRLLLLACLASLLGAAEIPALDSEDPALVRGALANQLRWAVLPNHQPEGKASLRLRIASGSLQEGDEQRGLAHFLEHMAFNGSERFPAGTLITTLQGLGIAFGQHSNAHTGPDETVYKLDLPDAAPATLATGLAVLADQAGGLRLDPAEVERERGVILAEMRDRDDPAWREHVATVGVVERGTRLPERLPIGTEACVRAASSERLRAYYADWYRPERMELAVVGAVEPAAVARQVEAAFAGLRAQPSRPEPDLGAPPADLQVLVHHDREASGTRVGVWSLRRAPRPADGPAFRRFELERDLAEGVLDLRLARLTQAADAPVLACDAFTDHDANGWVRAGVVAQTRSGLAVQGLALIERERQRMLAHGPTAAELAVGVQNRRQALAQAVAQAGNRTNRELANALVRAAASARALRSPAQVQAEETPWLDAITPASSLAAYRAAWSDPAALTLTVAGVEDLGAEGANRTRAAWDAAHAETPAAPVEHDAGGFAYGERPAAGAIAAQDDDAFAIRRLRFANGVAANLMRTTWQKDRVQVRFRLDTPADSPAGAREFASQALILAGLGRHSALDLLTLLAGRSIKNGEAAIGDRTVAITIGAATADLELSLQLLRAELTDPGWRSEGETMSKPRWLAAINARGSDIEAQAALALEGLLVGDDPHRRSATRAEAEAMGMAALRAWLEPHLRTAPLTVTVVGDVDLAAAGELVACYAGSLPPRPAPAVHATPADALIPGHLPERRRVDLTVPGTTARSLVILAWPSEPFGDARRMRRLGLLARALGERVRDELRERLGAAYSPAAWHQAGETRAEPGLLRVRAEVEPARAGEAEAAIRALAAALAAQGIDDALLAQVKTPLIKELGALRRTDRFWFPVAEQASSQPWRLAWMQEQEADYAAITAGELSTLAAAYLAGEPLTVVATSPGTR